MSEIHCQSFSFKYSFFRGTGKNREITMIASLLHMTEGGLPGATTSDTDGYEHFSKNWQPRIYGRP